jgi:hypothetical protein
MSTRNSAYAVSAMLFLLVLPPMTRANENAPSPPLQSASYGEWSAKWWQWAFASKFAQFADGTDGVATVDCAAGQGGSVWFLAGTITGNPVTRTCAQAIPPGKTLYFPLVNYGLWNPDASCPNGTQNNCTVEQKRRNLTGFFSDQIPGNLNGTGPSYACQLSAAVDGVLVHELGYPVVHTQSPIFRLKGDFNGTSVDDPKTVDEGYYVAIPPLGRGKHTITFTGGVCSFSVSPGAIADGTAAPIFLTNIQYNIRVGK